MTKLTSRECALNFLNFKLKNELNEKYLDFISYISLFFPLLLLCGVVLGSLSLPLRP